MNQVKITLFEDNFVCDYCGEHIYYRENIWLIQENEKTEIRHKECLEENLI